MATTINVSLKPLKNGIAHLRQNGARAFVPAGYTLWRHERADIQNPGKIMFSTSADTKGVLEENLFSRISYAHAMRKYTESGVPLIVTSQRSLQEINDEKHAIWREPTLTVSNGGSVAVDSLGRPVVDEQIKLDVATALAVDLEQASRQGKGGKICGVTCVGTKTGTFANLSRASFAGLKSWLHADSQAKFSEQQFADGLHDARNITFQIVRETKYKPITLGTSFLEPIAQMFGLGDALDFKFNFKLPIIRNPFGRKSVTSYDEVFQEEVTEKTLKTLLNSPNKQLYIDKLDVVLTKNGLSFVPKGVSKQKAIKEFCERTGKSYNTIFSHGDSFDDFFYPVSLADINKSYEQAKRYGKEKDFSAVNKLVELSKPVFEHPEQMIQYQTYLLDQHPSFSTRIVINKLESMIAKYNEGLLQSFKEQKIQQQAGFFQQQMVDEQQALAEAFSRDSKANNYSTVEIQHKRQELKEKQKQVEQKYTEALNGYAEQVEKMSKEEFVETLSSAEKNALNQATLRSRSYTAGTRSLRMKFENFSHIVGLSRQNYAPQNPNPSPAPSPTRNP